MGFEEILKRRLGPMKALAETRRRPSAPEYDLAKLFYRRALGVEIRIAPEESWATVEISGPRDKWQKMSMADAVQLAGLTRWTSAAELDVKTSTLRRWIDQDLLYFCPEDPGVSLTGESISTAGRLARRRAVHPSIAMESAIEIAPIPFMPRGDDLKAATMVGARFASRERGKDVLGVTITGSEKTGRCLRALVPQLDGTMTLDEIVSSAAKSERTFFAKMVEVMAQMTLLENAGEPRPRDWTTPSVTWLGHAAVLVSAADTHVLVDPLFFADSVPLERNLESHRFDPRSLPKIDAVLITHADNDHLNPNSLFHLPPETPIFVPRLDDPRRPYQVDVRGLLRLLGQRNLIEVDPWQTRKVGAFEITPCPFVGEDWDLELPQTTYLVESDGLSCFFSADAHRMDEVYGRIGRERGTVDVAFMGVGGCAETFGAPAQFGYGNFYADYIPVARTNEWVQHCAGPQDALQSLSLFEPRFAFGYASGGAAYIETSFSDTGDHEQLATLLESSDLPTRPISLTIGVPFTP